MPFNGSGTFTLAEAAFVPGTVINSTVMNSDLSDIATNGLTNAVTKDGQTVITAPIKFASGSVGLPSITFSADTDSGLYRIGANNIGVSVGGTKILDIASTGLGVVGAVSPSTTVTNAVGTVSLPSYTFTGDLNSGMYWIGADNIGVGVAGAKVLDISATGLNVVGTLSSNGAAFSPLAQGAGMVNGTIVESHTGNAATFAIKTLAGADPSATDIVYVPFRNVITGTGNYSVISLTAALSVTLSSGSTIGTANNVAFKLWFEIFNDGGTLRLGVINNVSGTNVYPLGQIPLASSTTEGGAGGADSAQVFYTGTGVTAKAYTVIGYAYYGPSVIGTAGSWAASPTSIELFSNHTPLPGTSIQVQRNSTGAVATGSTVIPLDDTIPQNTEGDQYLTQAITPTSAANVLLVNAAAQASSTSANNMIAALFQDSTASALATTLGGTTGVRTSLRITYRLAAGTVSSTTFNIRAGSDSANTFTFNGSGGSRLFGGTYASFIEVTEIMT